MPTVAIVGASADRSKFGNKSVRAHLNQGWSVLPIHPKAAEIEGQAAFASLEAALEAGHSVDRVALYLPAELGLTVLEGVARAGAELYINPGAGSQALREKASALGIDHRDACAIVAIGESPSSYP